MSLNGLDAPALLEAVQSVQSSSSAWFLLRYATRDEIELLGLGFAGIVEARARIAAYEPKSPLYGVVAHNGAKVLIKYVPPGTSRLLQARVKVHSEEIGDHFPHDASISISSPDELSYDTLAAATPGFELGSTHKALPPTPIQPDIPLNALRANEIGHRDNQQANSVSVPVPVPVPKKEEAEPVAATTTSRTAKLLADVRAGRLESHEVLAALKIGSATSIPFPSASEEPARSATVEPWERKSSWHNDSDTFTPPAPVRSPTADSFGPIASPRVSTSSNTGSYYTRQKVKLGPRPVYSPEPTSPGVASLPANISVPVYTTSFPLPPASPNRPTSSQTAYAPFRIGDSSVFPLVQAPASVIAGSYADHDRPASRAASVVTLPANYGALQSGIKGPKSPKEVPQEKLRLLKALELRRKQQAKERAAQASAASSSSLAAAAAAALSSSPAMDTSPHTVTGSPVAPGTDAQMPSSNADNVANGRSSAGLGIALEETRKQAPSHPELPIASNTTGQIHNTDITPANANGLANSDSRLHSPPSNTLGEVANASLVQIPATVPEETQAAISQSLLPALKHTNPNAPGQEGAQIGYSAGAGAGAAAAAADNYEAIDDSDETAEALAKNTATFGPRKDSLVGPRKDSLHPPAAPAPAPGSTSTAPEAVAHDFATGERKEITVGGIAESKSDNGSSDTTPTASRPDVDLAGLGQPSSASAAHNRNSVASSIYTQSDPRRTHSKDISISTSLGGASFLEELDETSLEEAKPVTLVKSPVTPTLPKANPFNALNEVVPDVPELPPSVRPAASEQPAQTEVATLREQATEPEKAPAPVAAAEPLNVGDPVASSSSAPAPAAPSAPSAPSTPAEVPVPTVSTLPAETNHAVGAAESHEAKPEAAFPPQQVDGLSEKPPVDSALTTPAASEAKLTPTEEREAPLENAQVTTSAVREESPAAKKHPTVQPPHIWGGPLRAASGASNGPPPRHLSPGPDLQLLTRNTPPSSGPGPSPMSRPESPSAVKKPGMGSRIADRIKALEKSSGGSSSAQNPYITPGTVSVSSRKSSFATPPGSSGVDASRKSAYPTPSPSPGSNIFTRRFGSARTGPASESGRTDTTIRPTVLTSTNQVSASSPTVATGDIQRPIARPTYVRETSSDKISVESSRKENSKPTSRDGALSPTQKRGTLGGPRLSFSGRNSSDAPRSGHNRQSSIDSVDKKDSKAKKLMKRVTGAFSPRKDRHTASLSTEPILEGIEQDSAGRADKSAAGTSVTPITPISRAPVRSAAKWNSTVVIGEVNIQFPDTLLWKRRHMELDSEGYVVLLPSATDRTSRIAAKKYHLSEFHPPYIPDQEREELPFSIILDFKESSTLQVACQNHTDQVNVLAALNAAYGSSALQGRR